MDLINALNKLGLSDRESKVYLSLLEWGESLASDVARKSELNRTTTYDILSNLLEKGLVTYIIKNNTRFYRPTEPEKILQLLQEKEKTYESILPQLLHLYRPRTKNCIVEVFQGKEGIKTIFNDILITGKPWAGYNTPGTGHKIMDETWTELFHRKRQNKKIELRVIYVKTKDAHIRANEMSKMKYTKIKFMKEKYDSPASNWIYGDRVALIFWLREVPFAIRIIDKELADSYRNHFNVIWKYAIELK